MKSPEEHNRSLLEFSVSHLYDAQPDGTRDYYMLRYILRHPWGSVRLHKIVRSDLDPYMHDHPFDFVSVLLTGGYLEHTPAGSRRWRPLSIVRRRAADLHRLELDRPVWTLVFAKRKSREWGFDVDGQWVYWKDYLRRLRELRGGLPTRVSTDMTKRHPV